jgi:biopolymer transport protein ExbD
MAGAIGRLGRIEYEPNVLPMIDVLLVLLIIFILASIRHVLEVQIPPATAAPPTRPAPQIVLELLPDGGFAINRQPVPDDRLEATLQDSYRSRAVKLLFIKAAPQRKYHEVVTAIDRSKGAGVQVVAIMP